MNTQPRILKSADASSLLAAGQFNYEDLKERCDNYLESVRQQARKMLTDAQQQVEQIYKNSAEQGRQAGLAEGLKQAESQTQQRITKQVEQLVGQRLQKITPPLQTAVEKLEQERQHCLARWDSQALELILAISEKLVHQQLKLDQNLLFTRITEVLQLAVGSTQITIRVADSDLAAVGPQLESLVQLLEQQAHVRLLADPQLETGDCLVETEHGKIDARIQAQLDRIASELMPES